jgi:DNA repair protein RadC
MTRAQQQQLLPECFSVAESCAAYGPEALSDVQLVEGLLDQPNHSEAATFLAAAGGLQRLLTLGMPDLQSLGFSAAEAARLQILAEVTRRASRKTGERVTSPRSAGAYLLPKVQGWTEERFGMLALNAKGEVTADRILGQGTATGVLISPREVMREALRFAASSVLVWHNHPSGDPTPSREDIALTKRLRQAGEAVGVPLADHIVLGGDRYHSFRAAEGWDG